MTSPPAPEPLYRQIMRRLDELAASDQPPDRLPTARQLAADHDCSLPTARLALQRWKTRRRLQPDTTPTTSSRTVEVVPVYQRIMRRLDELAASGHRASDGLPTASQLAQEFGCSLPTAKQALRRWRARATSPTDTSMYRSIIRGIETQIASGALRPGDRLPTPEQLARDYNCSPATARQAIERLQADQIITGHQGRGTYVR